LSAGIYGISEFYQRTIHEVRENLITPDVDRWNTRDWRMQDFFAKREASD